MTPQQEALVAEMMADGRLHFHSELPELMAAAQQIGYGRFSNPLYNPQTALKRGAKNLRKHVRALLAAAPRQPAAENNRTQDGRPAIIQHLSPVYPDDESDEETDLEGVPEPPAPLPGRERGGAPTGAAPDINHAAANPGSFHPSERTGVRPGESGGSLGALRSLWQPLVLALVAVLVSFQLLWLSTPR